MTRPDFLFYFFPFNGFFSLFHRITSKGIFFSSRYTVPSGVTSVFSDDFSRGVQRSAGLHFLFPVGSKVSGVPIPRLVTVCAKKRSGVSDKNTSPSTSELRLPEFLRKKTKQNQHGSNELVVVLQNNNNKTTYQVSDTPFIPVWAPTSHLTRVSERCTADSSFEPPGGASAEKRRRLAPPTDRKKKQQQTFLL